MARSKKTATATRRRKTLVPWTAADLKALRQHAGRKSLAEFGRLLKRTPAAVALKASKEGISLRRRAAR